MGHLVLCEQWTYEAAWQDKEYLQCSGQNISWKMPTFEIKKDIKNISLQLNFKTELGERDCDDQMELVQDHITMYSGIRGTSSSAIFHSIFELYTTQNKPLTIRGSQA